MALFGPLDNSASGMRTYQTWLDTVAANIANADDTAPTSQRTYAPEWVVAQADGSVQYSTGVGGQIDGGGVHVGAIIKGSDAGEIVYDPTNPIADAKGEVRQAQVDLPHQMTMMIQAERGYEANVSAITHAKDAYLAALKLVV
ncbi:flagellar basal body rod protein FlgC [Acidothermaceae bacterium B102]|nr:flagellar basal body rod protein FlgC [Acidothermaceae bacterium B102]